jgi:hypothetical protein
LQGRRHRIHTQNQLSRIFTVEARIETIDRARRTPGHASETADLDLTIVVFRQKYREGLL